MIMKKQDDRTVEQRKTHRLGVVAKDNFMSGWGVASGGASRCAWACGPGVDVDRVKRWVRDRDEMRYVSVVDLNRYRPPSGTAHFHIYVCDREHVANQ